MNCYEVILIIRQDVSSADIDKIVEEHSKIITGFDGEILKKEYWGIIPLAYEINNYKKAHYYLIGIKANNAGLLEMDRKLKLSESVMRFSVIKVESISNKSSPLVEDQIDTAEPTVDVTINQEAV